MRERPILFSGPMVRAILDGKKTQTRRVITPQPDGNRIVRDPGDGKWYVDGGMWLRTCPFGAPAGPWHTFLSAEPPCDGYYDVQWEPGDATVRAWLRRCENSPDATLGWPAWNWGRDEHDDPESIGLDVRAPWGIRWRQPGDRLWVRETWAAPGAVPRSDDPLRPGMRIVYRATADRDTTAWRPSIHMPRWASRITLANELVLVERVQDITEEGALREGVPGYYHGCYDFGWRKMPAAVANFRRLWEEINGAAAWDSNPWVWVVTFSVVEKRS